MPPDPRGASLTSLPNMLGLGRIAATPVIMALILIGFSGSGLIAFALFAAASATDFVDGRIARARNQVSPLGAFLDLAADKVLVAGVMISLVEIGLLPAWLVATILIRELVVQGVRQLAASEAMLISVRTLGKWKTAATMWGIGLLLLAADALSGGPLAQTGAGPALEAIGFWLMVVALVLTVLSGLAYLRGAWPILGGGGRSQAPPT